MLAGVPDMVSPSTGSTVAFTTIVVVLVIAFVVAVARAGTDEPPAERTRWALGATVGIVAWLAITGWASASGILESPTLPPRVMFFLAFSLGGVGVLAFTRVGDRLVRGTPIAALVGFQVFRLPLELVLHQWWKEGVLPVQMTYSGINFDIVTGVLAGLLGPWLAMRGANRTAIWTFNVVGLVLLATVGTIAVLSTPIPLRVFMNDPPVLLAFHFPFGWIVPFCVGGALFGHLLVFRWLRATAGARTEVS